MNTEKLQEWMAQTTIALINMTPPTRMKWQQVTMALIRMTSSAMMKLQEWKLKIKMMTKLQE